MTGSSASSSEADLLRGEVLDGGPAHRHAPGSWPEQVPRMVSDVGQPHAVGHGGGGCRGHRPSDARDRREERSRRSRDNTVVGVVSRSDIIHALATSDERIRAQAQELLEPTCTGGPLRSTTARSS